MRNVCLGSLSRTKELDLGALAKKKKKRFDDDDNDDDESAAMRAVRAVSLSLCVCLSLAASYSWSRKFSSMYAEDGREGKPAPPPSYLPQLFTVGDACMIICYCCCCLQ